MVVKIDSGITKDSNIFEIKPASLRFLSIIFLLLVIVQFGLYWQSFQVKPSGDDFTPPLADIHRGEREGPISFFKSSQIWNYRPLDSLAMWTFGSISKDQDTAYFWIRILHFLSYWFYAFVAFLWIRLLRFNRTGSILAGAIIFLHPVMAGPLASIDGSSRILVGAFIWLGAYFVFRYVNHSIFISSLLCAICFILGMGFMEYALALIPLGVLTAYLCADRNKIKQAFLVFIPMLVVLVLYMLLRMYMAQQGTTFTTHLSMNPLIWIKHVLIMYSGLLFFGNTVWIMFNKGPVAYIWFLLNAFIVLALMFWGLKQIWYKLRTKIVYTHETDSEYPAHITQNLIMIFLFYSIVLACVPMVFMNQVSEVYLSPLIIPFALIVGFSAWGWRNANRTWKYLAVLLIVYQLGIALPSIVSKVSDLVDVGENTEKQAMNILSHIKSDTQGLEIAIVFKKSEIDLSDSYSNFRRGDFQLIYPVVGRYALDWYDPGCEHALTHLFVDNITDIDYKKYDLVLLWDFDTKKFTRVTSILES